MRTHLQALLFASSLILVGCGSLSSVQSVASDPLGTRRGAVPRAGAPGAGGWEQGTSHADAPLYARDGSPVGPQPVGVVQTANQSLPHGLRDGVESRIVLLDLYQQAVDDRDELIMELELREELEAQSTRRVQELEAALAARQASLDEALAARRALEQQNFALAERLATATELRLEAEKKYLETAIAARAGSVERAGGTLPSVGGER